MPAKGQSHSGSVLTVFLKLSYTPFIEYFQVKSVLSDPKNGLNGDRALTESDRQNLQEVSDCHWKELL